MTCITQAQLETLLSGALPPQERAALLEHALACGGCGEALWQANAALPAAPPPPGLEARVFERAHARPRQESLRAYSLRVFAAMAAALALLFTGAFQKLAQLPQDLPRLSQSIQAQITELFDFTKEGLHLASEPE
jgi:ferric-dicitrate binding protein FerR (iron transport regulator)